MLSANSTRRVASARSGHEKYRGAIATTERDITERKQAETALKEKVEELRRLATVVSDSNDAVILHDLDGKILAWNRGAKETYGYTEAEALGTNVREIVAEPDREAALTLIQRIKHGEIVKSFELRRVTKDGRILDVLLTTTLLTDDQGNPVAVATTERDITERKQAEEALRKHREHLEDLVAERTAELFVAKEAAQSADRIKSAFLATMSHELRTPLNSIIGFSWILEQELAGPLNPEQAKQIGMVRGSARHLLELINDVLDLSKIEAGELEVSREEFDLRELVEQVVNTVRPFADKKGLTLSAELATSLGEIMRDRLRVEQIMLNLLGNAVKFTEQGGVALVGEMDPGERVRLSVHDTGIGIKLEELRGLFQPFRQVDNALSRNHEGTGLGLAICRRLADLLGGEVQAGSEYGVGSTFALILPMEGEGIHAGEDTAD